MKALQAKLRRVSHLLGEASDVSPKSGVWTTHVTREAIVANTVLGLVVIGVLALAWWATGRPAFLTGMLIALVCVRVISLTGQAVAVMLDRHPDRPPSNRVFLMWAALTALFGLPLGHLVVVLAALVQPLTLHPLLENFFPEMVLAFAVAVRYWRLVLVRLWFERLATEKLKRQAAEQGQALAETRLHMLEAQIEPHFLFTTLANVQQLVRQDCAKADQLLMQLVSYLRQAIPDVRGSASTLGREFELVRTYLAIETARIGERLAVTVACDPALEQVPFPSLIIHTLVENAIRHGVERKTGPVGIAVRARPGQQGIEISIEDSGVGLGETIGAGMGLRNVRERLALAYQGAARLEMSGREGGGACATICIPGPGR